MPHNSSNKESQCSTLERRDRRCHSASMLPVPIDKVTANGTIPDETAWQVMMQICPAHNRIAFVLASIASPTATCQLVTVPTRSACSHIKSSCVTSGGCGNANKLQNSSRGLTARFRRAFTGHERRLVLSYIRSSYMLRTAHSVQAMQIWQGLNLHFAV